jgi:hypothetical protein
MSAQTLPGSGTAPAAPTDEKALAPAVPPPLLAAAPAEAPGDWPRDVHLPDEDEDDAC